MANVDSTVPNVIQTLFFRADSGIWLACTPREASLAEELPGQGGRA